MFGYIFIKTWKTKFITTAEKIISKIVNVQNLVAKCWKMRKIQPCKICQFCILLYYKRKFAPQLAWKWCKFPLVIQKYTKLANFARLYFPHFSTFRDQILHIYYFWYDLFSCGDEFCFSCFNKNLAKHWNCPLRCNWVSKSQKGYCFSMVLPLIHRGEKMRFSPRSFNTLAFVSFLSIWYEKYFIRQLKLSYFIVSKNYIHLMRNARTIAY